MSNSCTTMDCSLPGFSVHGILQARILEWVAISFSRGSSRPRRLLYSTKKKMPHIQGQRRSPRKTVGIAKSCLESNPIPTRHTWRAQPNLCAPGPRDTTDIEPGLCLSVSCGGNISSGLLQEQGLWVQQTWIWHKSSWGRLPFTLQ